MTKGPVLIDLEGSALTEGPDTAPPVPDAAPVSRGQAMQTVAALSVRRPSRLARWFWSLLLMLLGVVLSVAAWDFVTGLLVRSPILGWAVTGLLAVLGLVMLAIALRELAAFSRLKRIDAIQSEAEIAISEQDLGKARQVVSRLTVFYAGREDTRWGRDRLAEYTADQFDASGLLGLAEVELLKPLDQAALREVEAAARQDYDLAVSGLLGMLPAHRDWRDGAIRTALLDVFNVLGSDPRVRKWRSQMARSLN